MKPYINYSQLRTKNLTAIAKITEIKYRLKLFNAIQILESTTTADSNINKNGNTNSNLNSNNVSKENRNYTDLRQGFSKEDLRICLKSGILTFLLHWYVCLLVVVHHILVDTFIGLVIIINDFIYDWWSLISTMVYTYY